MAHEEEKDDDVIVPGLPLTLGQLVILWEGIVLSCLDNILETTEQSFLSSMTVMTMTQMSVVVR